MDVSGIIKKISDEQTFGTNGFTKREFVITTQEQYPQDIKFELVKEKTALINGMQAGDAIKVHFNLRGSEWQGKNYVNLVAWRLEVEKNPVSGTASVPHGEEIAQPSSFVDLPEGADDDLPF